MLLKGGYMLSGKRIVSEGLSNYKSGIYAALKALFLSTSFLLCSCSNPEDTAKLNRVVDDLTRKISDAGDSLQKYAPDTNEVSQMTSEEISKLFSFEYLVKDMDDSLSPSQMGMELQRLGLERWECFNTLQIGSKLRFFCKRHPETYLRYIPRVF